MNLSTLFAFSLASLFVLFSAIFQPNAPQQTAIKVNPYEGLTLCSGSPVDFQLISFQDTSGPLAPRLDGLGSWSFKVSTASDDAQYFFDQGIRLVYAFNHAEAYRAFREAARLDPGLAMAYWGQAISLGPNINDPFPDDQRQESALKASVKAQELSESASAKEQALIKALRKRCTDQKGPDQQILNLAYHKAMKEVNGQFGSDPDVATLYAASIMNTMPWNYWDENWDPRPNTEDCVVTLENVFAEYPDHPGAHHYYIHIIEAKAPTKAIPSADALCDMMPAAGHMVHMPSHIYIGVGYYEKAAEQNRKAIHADQEYIAQCQAQGIYPLSYYPHNIHFLWAATSMMGASKEAIQSARKVANKVPRYMASDLPFIQDFMAVPLQAFVRFGKWNEILTTPPPSTDLLHTTMMWHYSRGMAYVRKGDVGKANTELEAIQRIGAKEEVKTLLAAYNNPTSEIAKIAEAALAGEIAAAEGNYDKAIERLTEAVQFEDALVYQEPAAWHAPVRQYLGAVLMSSGQASEAEAVYKKDLVKHPDNGWSLFGLSQALAAQGKEQEAKEVRTAFEKAWTNADVELIASVF